MKLTKYEHACFTVEHDDGLLVVDPGNFTTDFIAPGGVAAIVITHEHADHFDREQIAAIIDKNPDAIVVGHQSVVGQLETPRVQAVEAGDTFAVGGFSLEFFGGNHADIYEHLPTPVNLGVMINDLLYYPGDSFTLPGRPVDTLALPIGAPWLKVSETISFAKSVQPRLAFPTHDAVLSDIGKSLIDRLIPAALSATNIQYQRLTEPTEL